MSANPLNDSGQLGQWGKDVSLPLFQAALDAMSAHIAILDGKGTILAVNAAWASYAKENHLPDPRFGIGSNYLEICGPAAEDQDEDARIVSGAIAGICESKRPGPFHHVYLCPHPGDPTRDRWFHLTLQPFRAGNETYILASHEDITEQHVAERSRALLERAIVQSKSGVVITERDGRICYANPSFAAMTGYDMEEILGQTPRILKSGKISDAVYQDMWRTIESGQTWKGEVCNRRKNGSLYWEEQTISPMVDATGFITHFVAIKEDITQAHENALLREGMIRAASDAFLIMDSECKVIEWSQRAQDLFGWKNEEMMGRNFPETALSMDLAQKCRDEMATFLSEGSSRMIGKPLRLDMLKQNCEVFPAELSISAVSLDDVWRFTAFIRDLSHTARIEHQLQQSHKMEAIGQLTASVAHDFNNLLGIILGSLDLLAYDLDRDNKYLDTARNAAKRGADTIRSLMHVARRRPARPTETDVNSAIQEMLPLIRQTAGKNINVVVSAEPNIPTAVLLDQTAFNSAAINLVVNARDAMDGKGDLMIYSYIQEITHNFGNLQFPLPDGTYVVIGFDDNGRGMTPEVASKAFEPFFTTKEVGKGTGLGLSMVYAFCRQSGGLATIHSQPGQGCSVQMLLPLIQPETSTPSKMTIH